MSTGFNTVIRHGYHQTAPLRCGDRLLSTASPREHGFTPQYALVYLSTGSATYSDPVHREVMLKSGDAFQRFPEVVHNVSYSAGTATHYMAVPSEVFQLMKGQGLRTLQHPLIRLGTQHRFLARHAQLARELRNCSPQRLIVCLTHMQQFLVDVHVHALTREVSPSAARRIEEACKLLSTDFSAPVSMPDIASKVGLGYSNFRRMFQQTTGLAPGDYRVRRRIEHAQELLLGGLSAKEVAARLGYSDIYAFSTQFKKFTGLSPRQYCRDERDRMVS